MANLKYGDKAPKFELPGVDGKRHSLADLAEGKEATAVIFMCNHCPYVLAWLERIMAIAKEYAPEGVAFVGINANDAVKYPADSFENMQALAEERGLPFPYLHDEAQKVAKTYGAERTPEIFLFDEEMDLRYHGAPDDNYDESEASVPYLRDALDAVLDGARPPVDDTAPVGCTIKWK
ncbi:MAG: thioredoxin family protein [Anaerolineae bacterium]